MKKKKVLLYSILGFTLFAALAIPSLQGTASNMAPWLGISNVKNGDIWNSGKTASVKLGITAPKGTTAGKLDMKLYQIASNNKETLVQTILSGKNIGKTTSHTEKIALPSSLKAGIYILRCKYNSGVKDAPSVTANVTVAIVAPGQKYGWDGKKYYDIGGQVMDGIHGIYDKGSNSIKYYYFKKGVSTGGVIAFSSGRTYHFDANKGMQTGWLQQDKKWKYFSKAGSQYGEMATKWFQDGSVWYYADNKGIMQTGWLKDGSSWYYLKSSGAMATGWFKEGNTWYYLKSSGAMATGWQQVGSTWYYLKGSGAMQTGWLQTGGRWYYLKSSGAMATGWLQLGGTWYYLDASGAMATGSRNIGGKTYQFASSGAWIG